ncbi:HWE histidine kinase domain-containing protein [Erythrobacter sp. JK5]|uniref:HWE histidine kinase domain-containing protein n=1 Tax=Erythrobacter sp. JK5 TaxID=2829500 RepID=UPI001BAE134C|nr:HWE histidine kinase domain-containing protein [Erythrobacter sp. JK5]QUL36835.1 GAF domain-containing protein [Erythrobacter sp. JK5]
MNIPAQSTDLTECDREAIHLISAIQPIGGLIAVTGDWLIAHRSANCAEMLGVEHDPVVGSRLEDTFQPRAVDSLRDAVRRLDSDDGVERVFGLRLTHGGSLFDCALHCSGGKVVIEFEPHAEADYADHLSLIGPVLAQLEPIRDMETLCDKAATLVRQMLGYDRVMIYRFHPDESGEVIAEDRRDDLEPYLGLRYPRADIPQQARALFRRNKVRIIADMGAEPVPVEPVRTIDGEPLDLSMSVLRAHSEMHVRYMRNMGVDASMAIALVRQGRLWGMISCHHYAPLTPPYSLRTIAEMFGQMFSMMLDRLLINRSEALRARGRHLHDQLMVRLAGGTSLADSLPMLEDVLRDVIDHDGASMLIDGVYSSRGLAPSEDQFCGMVPRLAGAPISTIIASSSLRELIPIAGEFSDELAGALILPVSRNARDYLVLWRRPLTQTVTWAGNPEKAVAAQGERLEPRGSFSAWEETVRHRCADWSEDELAIAESVRVTLLEVVLRMSDEVSRERARAQEQQELLIAELNHRVRNILNLIRSLVTQSQHDALDVASFAGIIGGRISALASAHDNITRENWSPAPLSALFETELAAYISEKRERFDLQGEEVLVKPEAYTVLALVVHELVTNSAKYGSLCDRHGTLKVDLSRNRTGDLEIRWRESGGPPVKPPKRRGFGSTIIERSIPFELKGESDLRFKLSGLEADFLVPERFIVPFTENKGSKTSAVAGAPTSEPKAAEGMALPQHVLVVEDSMIIALDTEETLKRLGVPSVSVAGSVASALEAIRQRTPDLAIVDFNLGIESSEPVTKLLRERGVRFVLATGYAEIEGRIADLGAERLLSKPYGRSEIEELLISEAAAQAERESSVTSAAPKSTVSSDGA